LFNPVLFASEGAVVAGQMGMTMAALNGVQALTQSWINTKVPQMSMYIAQKQFARLDSLFNKTMKQMLFIGVITLFSFMGIIFLIQQNHISPFGLDIANRFLPFTPLCMMTWAVFTMLPINCWATYLRCHKREPLLLNSVVVGILCCTSSYTYMSKHNKFLEQHGCITILIIAALIVVICVAVYHWVHNGYPIMMPYLKSSGICK
jgi:hypothetical protein